MTGTERKTRQRESAGHNKQSAAKNLKANLALLKAYGNYTNTEIAAVLGVSVPTLRGLMINPGRMRIDQVDAISRLSNCTVHDLLCKIVLGGGEASDQV